MNTQIRIEVHHHAEPQQRAWLTMTVSKTENNQLSHDISIRRALVADGADDSIPHSHCQVLQAEITAGVLTGLRKAGKGWHIVLDRLGGANGDDRSLAQLPSIGFAVAGTLAVLHGTGQEDLEAQPHGGHGWNLTTCDAMSF